MIYIIRHGKTELNKANVLQGRSNYPLNDEGIRQAEEAAKMLESIDFDYVYSSPLIRAVQTAEIVKDKDVLKKLAGAKKAGAGMLTGCNAAVVVIADSEKADTWIEDSSIAMSFMMLMAEEQGIGNCWVQIHLRSDTDGNDAEQNVREILSVPEKFRVVGILSLGIPAEKAEPYTIDEADMSKVHTI